LRRDSRSFGFDNIIYSIIRKEWEANRGLPRMC
jgi:hypothetical protein